MPLNSQDQKIKYTIKIPALKPTIFTLAAIFYHTQQYFVLSSFHAILKNT